MVAFAQPGPARPATPGPAPATVGWSTFVDAFLAADVTLHRCIRQGIEASASYHLAANAWAAGCPLPVVRGLLLQAFVELLT